MKAVFKSKTRAAIRAATNNREKLKESEKCGCYYCGQIFSPDEIVEWCPELDPEEEVTAICPYCGIDSVIPDKSGLPLTPEFLEAMHKVWF